MAYRDMTFDRKTAKTARYWPLVAGGRRGAPISLQVALCDACFNRCIMCGHPERPVMHRMDAGPWIMKLHRFAALNVESVCYSGGDPMAYPDFNRVMEAHVGTGILFGMTITGYVPPTIDLPLLSRAEWVRVSLDALTPEVYERVRGKVAVQKVIASIDRMLAAGVKVGLGITLHADNVDELPLLEAFAKERGITDIETHHIEPDSGPKAVRVPLTWVRKIEPFQRCHAALYQLYIDAAGDVYPCCITAGDAHSSPQSYAIGNVWRDEWDAVWKAAVAYSELNIRVLPEVCRSCCVQRLSQINSIVDQLPEPEAKSFF